MNRKKICILVFIVTAIVSIMVAVYYLYQKQNDFWKEQAHRSFTEVLIDEVRRRGDINMHYSIFGSNNVFLLEEDTIKFRLVNKHGEKAYAIPANRFKSNIEQNEERRLLHSVIFESHPLCVDSINICWNNLLKKQGFRGKSITHLSVTDMLDHTVQTYSRDSVYLEKSDSLVLYTIGSRAEIEVTGFIYCPWWKIYTARDVLTLCCLVLVFFLLFFVLKKIVLRYRHFFIKEVSLIVETVMEKEVLVKDFDSGKLCICKLGGDYYYDPKDQKIKKGDIKIALTSSMALLLENLLVAENYWLSNEEIQKMLWPNHSNPSKNMYTFISRFRGKIIQVSGFTIESMNYGYRLILPSFSEKND